MYPLTFITAAVVLYGIVNRAGYVRALGLGGATAAGSAVVFGSVAVPTFYAVAIGAAVGLGFQLLVNGRNGPALRQSLPLGAPTFVACAVWSVFVTMLAPFFFDGLITVTPRATPLVAGSFSSSNVAQTLYFILGVCVMVFVARSRSAGPSLIALSVGTCTILSAWRYMSQNLGLPFPEHVFDNSPAFAYIETAPGGVARFRGVLTEPAGLAGISLITIAYMVPRAMQTTGTRRVGSLLLAGIALYLGIISTSATFVVAGVVTLMIAVTTALFAFLSRRTSWSQLLAALSCFLVIGAIYVLPLALAFVASTINHKIASTSYTERSSANAGALSVFLDTSGFGVGLGSARASSFLPTLLCSIGIVGALLYAAAFLRVVVLSAPVLEYRPVLWALVALMVSKIAAGPDLSDNTGVLWVSLGLLSKAAMQVRQRRFAVNPSATELAVSSSNRASA